MSDKTTRDTLYAQVTYLVAVGAVVRFVTAPLERVRCIQQTGGIDTKSEEQTGIFGITKMLLQRRSYWCLWRGTGYSVFLLTCEEVLKVAASPELSLAIRCVLLHPVEITRTFLLSDSCSGAFTRPRILFHSDFFAVHGIQQLLLHMVKPVVSSWIQSRLEVPGFLRPLVVSLLLCGLSQPFDVVKRRLLMHACLPQNNKIKSCKISVWDVFRGFLTNVVKLCCSAGVVSICSVVHGRYSLEPPIDISEPISYTDTSCLISEWITSSTQQARQRALLYFNSF